jgi:hypothetical protein
MLLFVSDLHLRRWTWQSLPNMVGDSYSALRQVVSIAIEKKVDAVVLGGDIFDAQPTPTDVVVFDAAMTELTGHNIRVLAIQGQHGRDRILAWHSIHSGVRNLDGEKPIEIGKTIVLQGFDNRPLDEIKECLATVDPRTNVLVLHQMIKGMVPGNNWDVDTDWVKPHIALVLAGDYHKAMVYNRPGLTTFLYGGSTSMQAIDEDVRKSVVLVHDNLACETIPLKTRPVVYFAVNSPAELATVAEHVKAIDDAPEPVKTLVILRYDPRVPDVESTIRGASSNCHYLFRLLPIYQTTDATQTPPSDDVTLEGCLEVLIDKKEDAIFFAFARDLLRAKDPKGQLAHWRKKIVDGNADRGDTDADKGSRAGKLLPA